MIKITCDSTADLEYLAKELDISIMPLFVTLDGNDYEDGVTITPQMIFDKYDEKKILPKTGARSIEEYKVFFEQALKQDCQILHFCISSELSGSYNNAFIASQAINETQKRVYVVDSRTLSSGIALLALKAMDLVKQGLDIQQIYNQMVFLAPKIQCSFVVDTLDFLHKGGRCSALTKILASILKIRPVLQIVNGKIEVTRKFLGSYIKSVSKYVEHTLKDYNTPDLTRVFITHAHAQDEIVASVSEHLQNSQTKFNQIIQTKAGATVTAHCGKGTIGILYINHNEQEKQC